MILIDRLLFQDVKELKQRVDHLSARSVDGSESTSNCNWELELQASMEKLNNLPFRVCESDKIDSVNTCDLKTAEVTKYAEANGNVVSNEKILNNDRLVGRKQIDDIYQGWQSLAQSPINSIINRSKIALKNSISKSLSNSPVNMGSFSFGKSKTLEAQAVPDQCSRSAQAQNSENTNEKDSIFNPADENHLVKNPLEASNYSNQKGSLNEKDNKRNSVCEIRDRTDDLPMSHKSEVPSQSVDDTQVQNISKATHSLDSTPVKIKSLSSTAFTNSLNNGLNGKVERAENVTQSDCTSSKAKELPLLSFFQKSTMLKPTKDKSCSMVNLTEKQNLKTLLDNSNLGNIQAVSVEKLANARHKLVGES